MPMPPTRITVPPVAEPQGLGAGGPGVIDISAEAQDALARGHYGLTGEPCGIPATTIGSTEVCLAGDLVDNVPDRSRTTDYAGNDGSGRTGQFTGPEADPVEGKVINYEAGVECTVRGGIDLDEWQGYARRRLEVTRWSNMAHELWTGAKSVEDDLGNRYLTQFGATVVNSGTGMAPIAGIAEIDAELSHCAVPGVGVLHMEPWLLDVLYAKNVIERRGGRWFTPMGSAVVTDPGYPGTGPDTALETPRAAPAAGKTWVYGTSSVVVGWESRVTYPGIDGDGGGLAGVMDTKTNDIVVLAGQRGLASWLCCHFAVLIDTTI